MRLIFICCLVAILSVLPFYAQHSQQLWCGSKTSGQGHFGNRTNFQIRHDHYDFKIVVHIVYFEEEENISDAQVYSQIEILNRYFNKSKFILPGVADEFKPFISSSNFVFCLADRSPNNEPTTGIVRVKAGRKQVPCFNLNNRRNIFYSADGGSDVWNTSKYINIYVCNLKQCGIIGEAVFPWDASPEEDGLIIDYRVFGDVGKLNEGSKFIQGKTLIHELGHFFGLFHLSKDISQCQGDDLVSDTPPQNGEYFDCPEYPQFSCGVSNMFQNFMSLTSDPCLLFFTLGQVERMRNVINQYRKDLIGTCIKNTEAKSPFKLIQLPAGWLIGKDDNSCWSGMAELYDSSGRRIWAQNKREVFFVSIPVSEINVLSGVYLLKISDNFSSEVFKLYKP